MADIPQTIQDFYRVISTRDMARDFNFRVVDVSNKGVPLLNSNDLVLATGAILPGKTISAKELPYNGFPFRIPGTVSYNNAQGYNIDFYCDAGTNARIQIENWVTETFDDQTSTGDSILHHNSNITLGQLNSKFEIIREYILYGVFPLNSGDISYSMVGDGTVMSVSLTFAYQFYRQRNTLGRILNLIRPNAPTPANPTFI